jgi:hypothetical protein
MELEAVLMTRAEAELATAAMLASANNSERSFP